MSVHCHCRPGSTDYIQAGKAGGSEPGDAADVDTSATQDPGRLVGPESHLCSQLPTKVLGQANQAEGTSV